MPGSKPAGSLGRSVLATYYPYTKVNSPVWFLRHLSKRSAVGSERPFTALSTRPKDGKQEITVLGDYPYPWKSTRDELAALKKGDWSPSTRDFEVLAANSGQKRPKIVDSLLGFLHLILDQPQFSIGRLNVITHADSDGIGFGGEIDPSDGTVAFFVADLLTEESLFDLYRFRELDQFNQIQENFIVHRGRKLRFTNVMSRFGRNAEIFVYACNAGVQGDLTKAMSRAFQVPVHAFSSDLDYWVPIDEVRGILERKNLRVAKHEGPKGQSTAEKKGKTDFHQLSPNVHAKPSDVYLFPSEISRTGAS